MARKLKFNIYNAPIYRDRQTYLYSDYHTLDGAKRALFLTVFFGAASIQGRLLLHDLVLSCGLYLRAPSIRDFLVNTNS